MMTDPIADLLTRIRNASMAFKDDIRLDHSKAKEEVTRILAREGYLQAYRVEDEPPRKVLVVEMKYGPDRERVISGLERISKPGRRVYARKDRLPRVLGGMGTAIMSTPQGLVTSRTAEREGIGGEVICFVW